MVKLAIKRPKKNLLPNLKDTGWVIGSGAVLNINGDYSFDIPPTGITKTLTYNVNVKPNTNYTISANTTSGSLGVVVRDLSGNTTILNPLELSLTGKATFNSGSFSVIYIRFHNFKPSLTEQTVNVTNFQLEEGSSSTSFEPYNVINKPSTLRPSSVTLASDFTGKIGNGYVTDYNGKKIYNLVSNFVGKVTNSLVENPNIFKPKSDFSIISPSAFNTEATQNQYNAVNTLDTTVIKQDATANNGIAMNLFSFDVISILERQFGVGVWNGKLLLSEKVEIAKQIISSFNVDWSGFGSSPTGNKASIGVWYQGAWSGTRPSHTNGTVTKLSYASIPTNIQNFIGTDNGWIHVVAYAEPSNGTVVSAISTDYIELQLTVHGVENPNLFRRRNNVAIGSPTDTWLDGNTSQTNNITTLNGTVDQVSTVTNLQMSQHMFSFNVVEMLERTYGVSIWNGASLLSDKVAIAKSVITNYSAVWNGFGTSPTGNKASFSIWTAISLAWGTTKTHTNGTINSLTISSTNTASFIDSGGFINFLANSEPSDGVTASTINTDYISLTVNTNITNNTNNTNIARFSLGSTIDNASAIITNNPNDLPTFAYNNIKVQDGTLCVASNNVNGAIAKQMFSFNAIDILEKQLGVSIWGGKTLLSDKISIAKQMITSVLPQWYGYGSGAGGNRATFYMFDGTGNSWWGGTIFHIFNTPQLLQYNYNVQSQIDRIDSNGWYHFLYTTYSSDGVTPSTLNTDYIKLVLTVNTNLTGHKTAVAKKTSIKYPKKNLFNKSLLEIGSIAFSVGNLFDNIKVVSNSRARFSTLIPIKPSTSYVFTVPTGYNMAIQTYTSASISISDSAWQNSGFIKTTESNAFFACILVKRNDNVPFVLQDIQNIQFQVEEGSVSTSYEIYDTQNKLAYYDPSVITITSDYVGKVTSSTLENPNIAKAWDFTSLITMAQWNTRAEVNQANVDKIKALDANYTTWSWNGSNSIAQHLFSFDVISILERQMGVSIWNGKTLLSDKIAIAKNIVTNVKTDWYGFGTSITGNKATVKWWSTGLSAWSTSKVATHSNGTTSLLSLTDNAGLGYVDSNGFMHVTAYAEPSDGVAQSVINTDYIKITLTVNNPLKQV